MLGVDFDDAEYGFKEEDKSLVKRHNEALLKRLTESCKHGTFGTMAEAVDSLSIPSVKAVRPYKTYSGRLGKETCSFYSLVMRESLILLDRLGGLQSIS